MFIDVVINQGKKIWPLIAGADTAYQEDRARTCRSIHLCGSFTIQPVNGTIDCLRVTFLSLHRYSICSACDATCNHMVNWFARSSCCMIEITGLS